MDLEEYMETTERALLAAYRPRFWRRPEAELFLTALRHETAGLLEDATAAAWDEADRLEAELRQVRAQMAEARKTIDLLRSHLAGGTRKVPEWSDAAREPATVPEAPPGGPRKAAEPRTPHPAGTGKGGSAQRRTGPREDGAA